ncbi:MAG: DinB family protein [Chthonomonadaceae bacterium]|nr:DinB family protein [Chthonomonadaceae bacterium]
MDIKAFLSQKISDALACYIKDIEALEEKDILNSPGGSARSPIDFTYEIVMVNSRIASRLKGEDPGPWPFQDGWAEAPEAFKSKSTAIAEVSDSTHEVIAAWNQLSDSDLLTVVPNLGEDTTKFSLGHLCATHLVYHDAQLNYVQGLKGDNKMHWD